MSEMEDLFSATTQGNRDQVASLLEAHPDWVHAKNDQGASPLHVAALSGNAEIANLLIEKGADVNCRDERYGATPAGWAIEYLRERGGMLAIELDDFEFAIRRGDVDWAERFIERFPSLRDASDAKGNAFRQLAIDSGIQELASLFGEISPE